MNKIKNSLVLGWVKIFKSVHNENLGRWDVNLPLSLFREITNALSVHSHL